MKKTLLLLFTVLIYSSLSAQVTIELYDENDNVITSTTQALSDGEDNYLKVENTGSGSIDVVMEITALNIPAGSQIDICFFGSCFPPFTTTGIVGGGDYSYTISGDTVYYNPEYDHITYTSNDETGPASFELTLRENENPDNSVTLTFDTETGLFTLQKNNIKLSPNPASEYIRIDKASEQINNYEIYNTIGQNVLTGELSGNTPISVSELRSGTYIIILRKNNTIVSSEKFIINN